MPQKSKLPPPKITCKDCLKGKCKIHSEPPSKVKRPSWDEHFLQIANLVSARATCPRLHVGAILVYDQMIVSTGYNGSPRKTDQCDEVGCRMTNGHCARTVHAEVNAVIQAAYHGISTRGATLYTRYLPCEHCLKVLINAGVEKIVFREVYKNIDQPFAKELIRQAGVKLVCSNGKNKKRS